MIKNSMEEISSVVWYSMELSSSITYFLRKLPKTRRYTLKCVMRPPAGDRITFSERETLYVATLPVKKRSDPLCAKMTL
jgi:hypothetical protein